MTRPEHTLRGAYINWLHDQLICESNFPDRSYLDLTTVMFDTEFKWGAQYPWSVRMDDNRLADGMDLRAQFSLVNDIPRSDMLELGPCSFLEVLLGLAKRLAFVAGGTEYRWAWQLVENLELARMWDRMSRSKVQRTLDILERVVQRQYEPNGSGGFFPLAWPERDQREVELWYQLNAYAEEQHSE